MPEVMEIPLELTFPSGCIKMVVMQPFVHLTEDEPFRWPDNKKDQQIQSIQRTLDIARDNSPTHFTLFPEYSIPMDGSGQNWGFLLSFSFVF